MKFTVMCRWCNTLMRQTETDKITVDMVSDGICPECSKKVMRDLEISQLEAMWRAS